ncbi:class I SAM-dependent methyltransferase [Reinekea sp.]|jgi:23S rRNA (guanine1835-N2)-methyltransferase|uniref:class I SAM-dependent methyltransferase n=1 Tax=Reinekea sp. TaxID=1970455 RepID=UPI003989A5DE
MNLDNARLNRVPKDNRLQAWSAADALMLSRISQLNLDKTLLVNDSFGALSLGLSEVDHDWWNDSAMSLQALKENCLNNDVALPNIIDSVNQSYDVVAIHIPKSLKLFEWQLLSIFEHCHADTAFYAAGMVKHLSSGHIKVMNRLFASVKPGKAEKKARVVELQQPNPGLVEQIGKLTDQYDVDYLDRPIVNLPGCFAQSTIDPGARAFLNSFSELPEANKVVDLGSGNGILAAAYLQQFPDTEEFHCIDDSRQAIESSKRNLIGFNQVQYWHNNSFNGLPEAAEANLILCNPPFHQSTSITETIAKKMFQDAARALAVGGELWIVANRHLVYQPILRSLFDRVEMKSKDPKFMILRCIK